MKLGPVGLRRPHTWKAPGSPAPRASQGMSQPSHPVGLRGLKSQEKEEEDRDAGGRGGRVQTRAPGKEQRAALFSRTRHRPHPPPQFPEAQTHRQTRPTQQPEFKESRTEAGPTGRLLSPRG